MALKPEIKQFGSYVDVLNFWKNRQPHKEVYRFLQQDGSYDTLTYLKLFDSALHIAGAINKVAKPGERILLVYPPGIELTQALWGCFLSGTVAVPLYPPSNKPLTHKFCNLGQDADASLILVSERITKHWRKLKILNFLSKIPLLNIILKHKMPDFYALLTSPLIKISHLSHIKALQAKPLKQPIKVTGNELAYLQYTSGSTGSPKGVMISHRNLVVQTSLNFERVGMDNNSRMVCWLPPYHDLGLIGGLLLPILGGGNAILMSPTHFLKNPSSWLKAISDYKATISGAPPFAYELVMRKTSSELMLKLDLSTWQHAFVGAEPIHANTLHKFEGFLKKLNNFKNILTPGYGLAESTLTVASINGSETLNTRYFLQQAMQQGKVKEAKKSSRETLTLISHGTPYEKMFIVDPKTKTILQEKVIGEIWLQGESVALGYWRKNEVSQKVFQQKLTGQNGRWMRTGDLGFMLDNELFITSRIKDLIIINGLNYHPQDIEFTIAYCHPSIRKGCVAAFTIQHNTQEKLVIVAEIYDEDNNESLAQHVIQEVATNHGIATHEVIFISPKKLPKTTSGKISRQSCKAHYHQNIWHSIYHFKNNNS